MVIAKEQDNKYLIIENINIFVVVKPLGSVFLFHILQAPLSFARRIKVY